jgi:hypothetical protein
MIKALIMENVKDIGLVLSEEHRKHGLQLIQDDHVVVLFHHGEPVASWDNNTALKISEIHQEADRFLGGDAVKQLLDLGVIGLGSDYT